MVKHKNQKKRKINPTLSAMFKMSKEELATRRMTGGGIHRTDPRFTPRSEQKRRAIEDETRL